MTAAEFYNKDEKEGLTEIGPVKEPLLKQLTVLYFVDGNTREAHANPFNEVPDFAQLVPIEGYLHQVHLVEDVATGCIESESH